MRLSHNARGTLNTIGALSLFVFLVTVPAYFVIEHIDTHRGLPFFPEAHAAEARPMQPSAAPKAVDLRLPVGEKMVDVVPNTYGNTYSGDMPFAYIRVVTRPMRVDEAPETYTVRTYDGNGSEPLTSWKLVESR